MARDGRSKKVGSGRNKGKMITRPTVLKDLMGGSRSVASIYAHIPVRRCLIKYIFSESIFITKSE